MVGEADIVDIGLGLPGAGHMDRRIPEPKAIDAVGALRDSEKGFPVPAFHAQHHDIAIVEFDGPGIEDAIDAKPLHEEGVGPFVEVIAPEYGGVSSRERRVAVAKEDTVAGHCPLIGPKDQLLILLVKRVQPFTKKSIHHCLF